MLLCQLLVTLFCLTSLQPIRIAAFSLGTLFLLPSVLFVAVLKFYRCRIHTSGWIQYDTSGLFLLCDWRCIYLLLLISFFVNSFLLALFFMGFHCCIIITIPKYLKWPPSSSIMSNNHHKSSLFSATYTVSSAYLKLLMLYPSILILGYPSRFSIIISL